METQSGTYNDMDALEAPLTAGTAAPNPLENTIQTYQQQAESEYNSERGSAGLSADEALRRLEEVGPNELSEKKENICLKFNSPDGCPGSNCGRKHHCIACGKKGAKFGHAGCQPA